VHRQGESPRALRVRLQGQYRHPRDVPKGRTVRAPCQGAARQSFDGHTLGPVVADMEKLTGMEARRIHVDKGYRGHNHPHRLRVWISGQVRRVTASIRREMKRRAAVEPVIGHVKAGHRMDRNYLKGRVGDRINAVLAAAGYNFGLLLRWLAELLRAIIRAFAKTVPAQKIA
jgi:IS5 family transposase